MGIATSIFVSTHLIFGIDLDLPEDANQLEGNRLSVGSICTSSSSNLRLPLVTVGEELLLVVQKLLASLGGILGVGG
jgi:hypothetical protein